MIETRKISKHFQQSAGLWRRQKILYALNEVSLSIKAQEVCCVIGESGCGKTTLGRTIMGLLSPTAGGVYWRDGDGETTRLDTLNAKARLPWRKRMQMIFQNPHTSLNPRMRVAQMLAEPVRFYRPDLSAAEIKDKTHDILLSVGGAVDWLSRYPHEFSGGQQQRLSIARALMTAPDFIVADEPVSALDVSVQAQVLNVLISAQERRKLTYLFITHDMAVVRHIGTKVAVMYMGTLCEETKTADIFDNPRHPYTQLLLSAIPRFGRKPPRRATSIAASPLNLSQGCVFAGRCPYANDRCRQEKPLLKNRGGGGRIACHAAEENRI